MRPGWKTSELTFAGLCGAAIYELGSAYGMTIGDSIARAAACLGLAWIASRYALARADAKGRRSGE